MGSESYTQKRWLENMFLLLLFIGLIFLSFFFLKNKSGLATEERIAYSIANTSYNNSTTHLAVQSLGTDFNQIAVPNFIQHYYNFAKTSFSLDNTENTVFSNSPSWNSSEYYTNYLTVEENGSFDYATVIQNCNINGMAPLYYLVFHTASSMFPFYSIKYVGFALNLLWVLGIFFVIFYICRKYLDSAPAGFAACILFCFSIGNISAILCTQNYLMTVFFMLLSCTLHLSLLQYDGYRVWKLHLLVLVTILGILTDYQFFVFALIEAIIYIAVMLCFSHFGNIVKYLLSILVSAIIVFALFPAVFSHIFVYAGKVLSVSQSGTIGSTFVSYLSSIQNHLLIRGNLCFAFLFLCMIVCILALVLNPHPFSLHFSNFKKRIIDMEIADIFLFALLFIYTLLLVLFEVPCSIKTFLGILPLASILICYLLHRFCYVFMKADIQIGLFIGAIVSVSCFLSLFYSEPDFLEKEHKETISLANTYESIPCIFIANTETDVYNDLLELGIQQKSMLIKEDACTKLKHDAVVKKSDQLILYLNNQPKSDTIIDDVLSYGKYSFSKRLYESNQMLGNLEIYLLYR